MDTIPLCHANSGKYLSKRFHELRDEAYKDESTLSTEEKSFAETSNMEYKNMDRIGMWEIETVPMAWYDQVSPELIDARLIRQFNTEQFEKPKEVKR